MEEYLYWLIGTIVLCIIFAFIAHLSNKRPVIHITIIEDDPQCPMVYVSLIDFPINEGNKLKEAIAFDLLNIQKKVKDFYENEKNQTEN